MIRDRSQPAEASVLRDLAGTRDGVARHNFRWDFRVWEPEGLPATKKGKVTWDYISSSRFNGVADDLHQPQAATSHISQQDYRIGIMTGVQSFTNLS